MRRTVCLFIVLSLVSVCGCIEKTSNELRGLIPVSGILTFKGVPAPGAVVMFYPETEREAKIPCVASAVVREDGTFKAQTAAGRDVGNGLHPGRYLIAASWIKNVPSKEPGTEDTREFFPTKYQKPDQWQRSIEVTGGSVRLEPIEIMP